MGRSGVMLVLWVLVLVQCVWTEDRSGLREAVRNVEDAIRREMMIEPVRYSDPNLTLTYRTSTDFNARGMGNLYKVTNFFMDIIQREEPYPEGNYCLIIITGYKIMIIDQLVAIHNTFCIDKFVILLYSYGFPLPVGLFIQGDKKTVQLMITAQNSVSQPFRRRGTLDLALHISRYRLRKTPIFLN
jgi:hypothetical protein